jgi:hypothetical protein
MSDEQDIFFDDTLPRGSLFRRLLNVDTAIVGGGIALAVGAAFFPWYVFFHQESFGVRPMTYSTDRPLSDWPGTGMMSASPIVLEGEPAGEGEFDMLMTATVPEPPIEEEPAAAAADPLDQPFPGSNAFRLLHVANGRALIEDSAGMYMVQIGSVLPDNSRLARLERRDGTWVIVTSEGAVIER